MVGKIKLVSLEDLVKVSEEKTQHFLCSFLCEKNKQLEVFLHNKSIDHTKRNMGKTFLLVESGEDNEEKILGYFTLLNKVFDFAPNVSNTTRHKITGNRLSNSFSTILIGNIAKNENAVVGGVHPISGKTLLDIAISKCKTVKQTIGLRIVAVEYEDNEKLNKFYSEYGFLVIQDNENTGYKIAYIKI